ncbi:MAG TPA: heavy metal translocating P-type ATPase [Casimicrobiaceae bacterium]
MFLSPRPAAERSAFGRPSFSAASRIERAPSAAYESEACFHCAAPVPAEGRWRLAVDGAERAFCCAGCLGIAQTIRAAGLSAFYVRRTEVAETPPDTADEWTDYDIAAEAQGLITRRGEVCEISLLLEGIRCAACIWLSETYVRRIPGVVDFRLNFATQRAALSWRARELKLSEVLRALSGIGYRAHPYDPARREALARKEGRALLTRTALALLAMMQVMMLAIPAYISSDGVEPEHARLLAWASLVLTVPVVLYSAAPFFAGALRGLKLRRFGMDVPVALGVGAAFIASAWATVTGASAVYFDSVTMFVALLLVARYVEFRARQRAGAAIEAIARARPETAVRLPTYPDAEHSECVPARALAPGDIVRVATGAPVPADGEVVAGRSSVEEAILTGESWPRAKAPGSTVLAGSVNRESPLVVRVSAAGEATAAAALSRLVQRAAEERPRIARLADRVAGWFVAVLLAIAAATALVWVELDPSRVLIVTVAVLVVSCPCALSLATPTALATAAGALGRRGVLAVRTDALEALSRVTHLVIDKTGTLTTGSVRLTSVEPLGRLGREECLAVGAGLEQGSTHPIATALRAAGPVVAMARDVVAVPGQGVTGMISGRRYRCGRPAWAGELHGLPLPAAAAATAPDAIAVALADEAGWIAWFTLGDSLRSGAAELVAALRAMGIAVSLVSGDRPATVEHVAASTGIGDWRGAAGPEAKRAFIAARQRAGQFVAMVGDGINDAPSLAQADVSISLGSAAALTQWTADVVVLGEDLQGVSLALTAARRAFRVIRQNLAWAFAYNAIAIPLAATGCVTPLAAALGMSASSILVVANAWRLSRMANARPEPVSGRAAPAVAVR